MNRDESEPPTNTARRTDLPNDVQVVTPNGQEIVAWCNPDKYQIPSTLLNPVSTTLQIAAKSSVPTKSPAQIFPSPEEVVTAYFKQNFFTPDPVDSGKQLSGIQDASSVLNQALLSLGTLSIANNHGSYDDLVRARHRYGVALRSANNSLKDPRLATNDDTLSGILLLAMFEVGFPVRSQAHH